VRLKEARLEWIRGDAEAGNFVFAKLDIADKEALMQVFEEYRPEIVVNLAAQAGVRYSVENPAAYIEANVVGFLNILEAAKDYKIEHLIYASSSSVYGNQKKVPFSVSDDVSRPISIYAATKKTDELMAHVYSHMFGLKTTGLRFFTVYGPWGRPDMAYFKFTEKIYKDEPIQVYNNGDLMRDFTYVDDIVDGIARIVGNGAKETYNLYNIGNNKPVKLMDFINILEKNLGKEARKEFLPMQDGDVYQTFADISEIEKDYGFRPKTSIEEGLEKFVEWYKGYSKRNRDEK
jgi:UDP-glucuronate 4-epimerase